MLLLLLLFVLFLENGIGSMNGGIHHRPTPPVGPHVYTTIQSIPPQERISEGVEPEEEELREGRREMEYEMSPELQALNISNFLSSGSESGEAYVSMCNCNKPHPPPHTHPLFFLD